jgi:mono/diheme cytochrome c family protein
MRKLPYCIFSIMLLANSAFCQTSGRELYIAKCAACHATDGSGNTTIGRSLNLGDMRPTLASMTDDQLRQIILEGKGRMPAQRKFENEKVRKLTLFLRDLSAGNPDAGKSVAEAQAQPLQDVEQVFRDKCSACHAQDGSGRTTIGKSLQIPDLTATAVQKQSSEELAEAITKGRGRMPGYAKTFNPVQVDQLASYIRGMVKHADAQPPTESAKAPTATAPSSLPTQITTQPESTPLPLNRAGSTLPEASAAREKRTTEAKPPATAATSNARKAAWQIYVGKCSACHSRDGSGTGTIGRSMHIPSLTSAEVQGKSDENLEIVISNGSGKMPAYKKKFSPEQIQLLVAYIRELGRER